MDENVFKTICSIYSKEEIEKAINTMEDITKDVPKVR